MFSIFSRINTHINQIKIIKCFISEIRLNRDRTNDLIPEVGSLCCFCNETSRNKPFIIVEKSHGSCIGLIPSGINIWIGERSINSCITPKTEYRTLLEKVDVLRTIENNTNKYFGKLTDEKEKDMYNTLRNYEEFTLDEAVDYLNPEIDDEIDKLCYKYFYNLYFNRRNMYYSHSHSFNKLYKYKCLPLNVKLLLEKENRQSLIKYRKIERSKVGKKEIMKFYIKWKNIIQTDVKSNMKEFNELNDELILNSVYRIRNIRKEELLNSGDYLLKSWLIPEILKSCKNNNIKLISEEIVEEGIERETDDEKVKENLNMLISSEMEDEFIKLFNEDYEFSSIFYSNLNVLNSKNPPRIPEHTKKEEKEEKQKDNNEKEEKNELSFPVEIGKYKKYYKDLRNMRSFAIDSDDTFEVDDSIGIDDKTGKIYIHISDPSNIIPPNSYYDIYSRYRGTTSYLPHRRDTMFPNDIIKETTLKEDCDNFVITFECELNSDGSIKTYDIYPSVISGVIRFNYKDLQESVKYLKMNDLNIDLIKEKKIYCGLDNINKTKENEIIYKSSVKPNNKSIKYENELKLLLERAKLREIYRSNNGSVIIRDSSHKQCLLDNDILYIKDSNNNESYNLVMEMMLLGGEISAKYGIENKIALPYRSMILDKNMSGDDMKYEVMKTMNTNMNESLISYFTMRNFNRAFIDTIPHYHSGVGLDYYCQSTSPIRRYNDILVHRQIKSHIFNDKLLSKDEVNEICQSVHEIHKVAKEIEFEVSENWLYADLLRRYKNNKNELYNGVIMGINSDRYACELEILLSEFGFCVNVESNQSYVLGDNIKLKMKKEPTKSINASDWLEIV